MGSNDASVDVTRAGPIQHCDSPVGVSGSACAPLVTQCGSRTLGASTRNVITTARVGINRAVGSRCGQINAELESYHQSHPTHRVAGGFGCRPWVSGTGHCYLSVVLSRYALAG